MIVAQIANAVTRIEFEAELCRATAQAVAEIGNDCQGVTNWDPSPTAENPPEITLFSAGHSALRLRIAFVPIVASVEIVCNPVKPGDPCNPAGPVGPSQDTRRALSALKVASANAPADDGLFIVHLSRANPTTVRLGSLW